MFGYICMPLYVAIKHNISLYLILNCLKYDFCTNHETSTHSHYSVICKITFLGNSFKIDIEEWDCVGVVSSKVRQKRFQWLSCVNTVTWLCVPQKVRLKHVKNYSGRWSYLQNILFEITYTTMHMTTLDVLMQCGIRETRHNITHFQTSGFLIKIENLNPSHEMGTPKVELNPKEFAKTPNGRLACVFVCSYTSGCCSVLGGHANKENHLLPCNLV
jgi:hypothetical protein